MNPSSGEIKPQFETPQGDEGLERQHDRAMEQTGGEETAVGKQSPKNDSTALALPADIPDANPVAIPADQTQADKSSQTAGPKEVAHDSHRIEKQWVERAKKVIAQTKDDPHTQKHNMSLVKADYIHKRFNKTIPTDDTAAA
ncbi:MAG: hypothetical protein ABSD10_04000 [Candidatus Saccharimonadales bacterium]|jgi:hypothetical protein